MEGKSISGRFVRVGDVIMNEWTGKHMTVVRISDDKIGRRHSLTLHCVRLDNGKPELLHGNYWRCKTRLIKRDKPVKSI